ncbi:hypothetical protein ACFW2K_22335 [Streptomyces nigra]|uniref:hypothetical protein n=1 Tax=Streptomyces nigra TaxID=1827580 RepID=UPI0036D10928
MTATPDPAARPVAVSAPPQVDKPRSLWRHRPYVLYVAGEASSVACRLVFRFIADKDTFLNRVRQLLVPGGTFWVVTELADRRADDDPLKSLGITAPDVELLTSRWSTVAAVDLDRLACFALRP